MAKVTDLQIPRQTTYFGIIPELGDVVGFGFYHSVSESEYAYSFNLTYVTDKYNLTGLTDLGTGQTQSLPYTYPDSPVFTISIIETTNAFYTIRLSYDDSLSITYCNGVVLLPPPAFSPTINFDFSPLLTSVATSANQNFLRLAAGTKESLASTLADLDIALSDATSKETASTPIIVSHFSTFLTGFKTLLTSISSASAFSAGSGGSDSDIVDANNLSGSYCKYVNGQVVYYGTYGLWVVTRAFLVLTSDNALTPFYDLRADDGFNSAGEPKYRYCTVPQDYVYAYVPDLE